MKTIVDRKIMHNDSLKGAIGMLATIAAISSSFLTNVEQWLRILSLSGGLVVCAFTVWSMWKSNKRKDLRLRKGLQDEETTWK